MNISKLKNWLNSIRDGFDLPTLFIVVYMSAFVLIIVVGSIIVLLTGDLEQKLLTIAVIAIAIFLAYSD